MAAGVLAGRSDEDDEGPWDDWMPDCQTAYDVIKAVEDAQAAEEAGELEGGDDDSDGWNPMQQEGEQNDDEGADDDWAPGAQEGGEAEAAEEDEEDEESDDDWAPGTQQAANVEATEKQALEELLKPASRNADRGPNRYESKKEADTAGRMLTELHRPPTIEEAKADIPRGPDVDVDNLPPPKYRTLTQEEAIGFVDKGASINLHVQHGRTPLHKAAEYAYPLLVKAICDVGGEPDIRDNYGETPLLLMSHSGPWNDNIPKLRRSETIQMLLSCGADVHVVNPRGRNCLHLASAENDQMAIETLIEGMANVNAQDLAGFTPLMWAAGRNGTESVKMMLDYEADMNIKANRGQTAMTFALTNGCSAIVDILESHQMLLDREEAKRIKEKGEGKAEEDELEMDLTLQLPKPAWACQKPPPEELEAYQGRRVYLQAKPDRRSNVYT